MGNFFWEEKTSHLVNRDGRGDRLDKDSTASLAKKPALQYLLYVGI